MMTSRIVVAPAADYAARAAAVIAEAIRTAVASRGRCSIALAGGRTPEPVYGELARMPTAGTVLWPAVHVFFGDERAVPPDAAASNFRMATAALLSRVAIPESQIHRMEAERVDREAAAREYADLLPDRLDVLLLGLGADGHTASLFPHAAALHERIRRVVPVDGPAAPTRRLTVTPPVVSAAREAIVLVAGAPKAAIVAEVLDGPERLDDLPAQLVRGGTWILDDAAAALLRH